MGFETKMTTEENVKDIKAKKEIREANYGVNAEEARADARNKLDHIPYDPKADTRNRQNTVQYR